MNCYLSQRINFGKHSRLGFATLLFLAIFGTTTQAAPLHYPPARRDSTVENYHGTPVSDPYRWLEDDSSREVQTWTDEQNQLTDSILSAGTARTQISKRLTELWNYPQYSAPQKVGEWEFFTKNDGLQRQPVLYRRHGANDSPQVVIDPNKLSADGTVALASYSFSKDARYMAYGLSDGGSDWEIVCLRDLTTGANLPDTLRDVRGAGVSWKKDNSGFYYTRYPAKGTVSEEDQGNYAKVYWHSLGQSQVGDVMVFERADDKELGSYASLTDDERYLIVYIYRGTDPVNRIWYCHADSVSARAFHPLFDEADASYSIVATIGDSVFLQTDYLAPKNRLVAFTFANSAPEAWRTIITEGTDVMVGAPLVAGQFVANYLHDAHSVIVRYSPDGKRLGGISLPTLGTASLIIGEKTDTTMLVSFESFIHPPSLYRYSFSADSLILYQRPQIAFSIDDYETTDAWYPSKDGTPIHIFITAKKGTPHDGSRPLWLWGYGGFNVNYTPSFLPSRLLWIEQGGIYCVANLRGDGEFGEEWHRAGMLANKQNVFDDYYAAAGWLVANKYTSRDKLLGYGRSNGGLLTATAVTQRPDLFGAIITQVPLTDMLRYQRFTIGRYWTGEYGNAEKDSTHFRFLLAYSPLHNVRTEMQYPPTLVVTGEFDDRVAPRHSRKFTAALQAAQVGPAPILLRVDRRTGHRDGKPTDRAIAEEADMNAFGLQSLGVTYDPAKENPDGK